MLSPILATRAFSRLGSTAAVGICLILLMSAVGGSTRSSAGPAAPAFNSLASSAKLLAASAGGVSTTNISAGSNLWGITYDPSTGYVIAADNGGQNVDVIDGSTNTLVSTVKIDTGYAQPTGIAYDSASGNIYTSNWGNGDISVVGGSNLTVWKHVGGGGGWGALYDPVSNDILVTYDGHQALTVLSGSTNKITANVTYGPSGCSDEGGPTGVYDAVSNEIFIPDFCGNTISVLNASTLATVANVSIAPSSNPYEIALDTANNVVYVGDGAIYEIGGTNDTQFGTIPGSSGLTGSPYNFGTAGFDPANGQVYFSGTGKNLVDLNPKTGSLGPNVTLPGYAYGMVYDSGNHEFYVAQNNGEVTVLAAAKPVKMHSVSFDATGLSPGLAWSITIKGVTKPSTGTTISFSEKPALYTYKVSAPIGYKAKPASGTVNLTRSDHTVTITLQATSFYSVTFHEFGLPSGFLWSASVNGAGTTYGRSGSSTATSISLSEPNGLWGYSVSGPFGYSGYPTGGSFTVSGASPPTQQATFAAELNIGVGNGAVGVAYSSWDHDTFVAETYTANVTVINDSTNQAVASIPTGTDPEAVLTESYNSNVYVANSYSDNVTVISGATLRPIASVSVGTSPYFMLYDPIVNEVYVSNSGGTTVSAIWVKNNTVAATITVAGAPQWITEDTATGYLYVENANSCVSGVCSPVSVVSDRTNKVVATVTSSSASGTVNFLGGADIAYDPSNGDVYLLSSFYLYAIASSNDSVFKSFELGTSLYGGLLYDPLSGNMLVSGENRSVTTISSSTNTVIGAVQVASSPGAMVFVPTAGQVYVADTGGNTIAVLSASTGALNGTITVSYTPIAFSFDPTFSNLYADCWASTVSIVFPPRSVPTTSWPVISNVSTITSATGATVTIIGSGFGINPSEFTLTDGSIDTIASNSAPSIVVADSGEGSHNWSAGHETTTNIDAIGLNLTSWNDSSVVFKGFGIQLGKTWSIGVGDPIQVRIYGPNQDGLAVWESTVGVSASSHVNATGLTTLHSYSVGTTGSVVAISEANTTNPLACACAQANLTKFSAYSSSSATDSLQIYRGNISYGSSRTLSLNYTESTTTGTVVIYDLLILNGSLNKYQWIMTAFYFPTAGTSMRLSDSFNIGSNSTLNQSLVDLQTALHSVALAYLSSSSAALVSQGTGYLTISGVLSQLELLLPSTYAKTSVTFGTAVVIDPLWSAFGYEFQCETFDYLVGAIYAGSTVLDTLIEFDPDDPYAWAALGGAVLGSLLCKVIAG